MVLVEIKAEGQLYLLPLPFGFNCYLPLLEILNEK
jgi:hypothetical protein